MRMPQERMSLPRQGGYAANLFIFQTQQENLLHKRELRLFAPFLCLADIPGVKGDFMPIFGVCV
jgi:hypothetical protein